MRSFLLNRLSLLLFAAIVLISTMALHEPCDTSSWGFFGHRLINRKAVFTLPQEMLGFYKKNIEFVTEHAVDPDKRRYAVKQEAVRHYIDIDHWGSYPYDNVPRTYAAAFWKFADVFAIRDKDTIRFTDFCQESACLQDSAMIRFFDEKIYPDHGDEKFEFKKEEVRGIASRIPQRRFDKLVIVDEFSQKGLLPYFFPDFYRKLVFALRSGNPELILKYSAEIGHYIGDAHVPLHTTENYNGQLSNQIGIHAFWESRIPELFADGEYDFFVGKSTYIPDMADYIWEVVLESNLLVDSVLQIEQRLKRSFPEDMQYCFDERLDQTVRVQCPEYAAAYQQAMSGMVEERMQDAIKSLGSVWFSAWIDAGSPDLNKLELLKESKEFQEAKQLLEEKYKEGNAYGREHGG